MSADTQHKPEIESRVKKRPGRPKKPSVASINLAVAKEKAKAVKNWQGFAWSPALSDCLNAVAKDVAGGLLDEDQCRRELLSACRFACESADQDFDSIEADVEQVIGGAIANAHDDRTQELAAQAIIPDVEQPAWVPKEGDFLMSKGWLYRCATGRFGEPVTRKVCLGLEIVGTYMGASYGYLVKVRGIEVQVPAAIAELRPAELTALLVTHGLVTDESIERHNDLTALFKRSRPAGTIEVVKQIGWQNVERSIYVLPDAAFGPGVGEKQYRVAGMNAHSFKTAGSYEGWRDGVAAKCVGNDIPTFAMCVAASAPFAGAVDGLTGLFHLNGVTSEGKSTVLHMAGSFWGGGGSLGYLRSWNATANSLIGQGVKHNHALVAFDELHLADGKAVGIAAYQLQQGQGRGRQFKDGTDKPADEFATVGLSTGEMSVEEKVASTGCKMAGGQEVRIPTIDVGADVGMPIFPALHDTKSSAAFAREMFRQCSLNYGHAARLFIAKLAEDFDAALERIGEIADAWMQKHCPEDLPNEYARVGRRFAVIAACGELAAEFGVLPWAKGVAFHSVGRVFVAYLRTRDGKPKDIRVGENSLRTLIACNESRFAFEKPIDGPSMGSLWENTNGWFGVLTTINGEQYYAISQDKLRKELRDVNLASLLRHLIKDEIVKPGDKKHNGHPVNTPIGRKRFICIKCEFVHPDMQEPARKDASDDVPEDDGKAF
jgi:uncharacterized protein (DUF927 family)